MLLLAAPVVADPRREIQAAYDQSSAAERRRDAEGPLKIYTKDWVGYCVDGRKTTVAVERQFLTEMFAVAKSVKAVSKITAIKVHGNSATVGVREHVEMRVPNPQTGEISTLVADETAEDEWVLQGGAWRIKSSRNLTESGTLDPGTLDGKKP